MIIIETHDYYRNARLAGPPTMEAYADEQFVLEHCCCHQLCFNLRVHGLHFGRLSGPGFNRVEALRMHPLPREGALAPLTCKSTIFLPAGHVI